MKEPALVVSGSFRKHYKPMTEKILEFEKNGFKVLSPKVSKIANPLSEFVILESDTTRDIKTLQTAHLDAISQADALFIFNPQGYIGNSASLEIGWALANKKPVYCLEQPAESLFSAFITVATGNELKDLLLEKKKNPQLTPQASLQEIQQHMHEMTKKRGFEDETASDTMLLMVEEVGELAKALRKQQGLKVDLERIEKISQVADEIADIFIYLLILSDQLGVNLFDAFSMKEQKNNQRTWARKDTAK